MTIKLKRLNPNAVVLTQGTDKSAGYDLYACIPQTYVISPHKTVLVPIGWAMEPPKGYYIAIVARSGLSVKKGLRPSNCYAVIDEDYRGEIKIPLHNDTNDDKIIAPNERIAQMLLKEYNVCEFVEVDELNETERGNGGFGSTGR